jgi:hypothetical protein
VHNRQIHTQALAWGGGMTSGVKFGLAHSSNGLQFLDDFSEFICDLAYIIFDSSSIFSCGSFDIIRDSRRWLIIAGQE